MKINQTYNPSVYLKQPKLKINGRRHCPICKGKSLERSLRLPSGRIGGGLVPPMFCRTCYVHWQPGSTIPPRRL